jgi:cysteine desulfurase family protein
VSHLFGIQDSSRLVFTHSATESLNLALQGILKPGDHVITTTMEHNSMARPLHMLTGHGVHVTWAKAAEDGFVSPDDITSAIRPDTKVIAVTHCSNVTGTIQPILKIGEIAENNGIIFLVDAAQSAGSIPINVMDMQIDLLAAPGHKGLMGPPGTGILYIADGIDLKPILYGGTGNSSASLEQPEALPERFESGTQNTPAIAGLLAGATFVTALGVEVIARHEADLVLQLIEGLKAVNGLKMYGQNGAVSRGSLVSFTLEGMDPSQVGYLLDHDYDIAVRTGLHCAPMAHKTIGTFPHGTIRVSPGWFNTGAEIAGFVEAIAQIARRKR